MDTNLLLAKDDENLTNSLILPCNGVTSCAEKKGVSLTWKNLSVFAEHQERNIFKKTQKSYKRIIHNVTGAIFPGNLVAVMGSSGSGKTTLISVLANRRPNGLSIEGDTRINGKPTETILKQISGYVYQDDLFIDELTVTEHLNFAAKLRLDKNTRSEDRNQLITKVLRDVGLLDVANNIIGGKTTNLSGGERKRLSVATELLTEAQLLFCDEPTTGLDSYSALKLVTTIQKLVIHDNKTIVCSIHQPNKLIFELFDQIILLTKGKIAFNGSRTDALKFFQSHGCRYDEEQNPAEYLIRSLSDEGEKFEKRIKIDLPSEYLKSEYFGGVEKYVDYVLGENDSMKFVTESNKNRPPSWLRKFVVIMHRSSISIIRTAPVWGFVILYNILVATFIGLCLRGTIKKTQSGIKAFRGVYVILDQMFFAAFYKALFHFPNQMALFYREYSNNSTSPFVFYLSNVIVLLPWFLIEPLCCSAMLYYMAGLRPTPFANIIFIMVIILMYNGSAALGFIFSIFFQNLSVADACGNPVMYCFAACNGLFMKLSSIPHIFSWIYKISVYTYACASVYIVQWEDVHDIECSINPNVPCLRNGIEVLENYQYDKFNLYDSIGIMLLLYFVYHLIAYLCLLYRIKNRVD